MLATSAFASAHGAAFAPAHPSDCLSASRLRLYPASAAAAGDPAGALRDLQRSVALSTQLGEASRDADTLGEMGDLLTGGWLGGLVGGWLYGCACCYLLLLCPVQRPLPARQPEWLVEQLALHMPAALPQTVAPL